MVKIVRPVFFLVFIFVTSLQVNVFGYNFDYEHQIYSDIKYYGVNLDTFNEFIQNPSVRVLDKEYNFMESYFVDTDTNVAFVTPDTQGTACVDNEHIISSDGIYRDGYKGTITPNTLKYLTKENLSRILKENNVDSPLENYAVFTVESYTYYDMPLTVWLETNDKETYFLAFMYDCRLCRDMVDYSKADFMTYEQFKDKFSMYDGRIYFKDLDITENDVVKIQNNNVFISFEYLLKKLGSTYVTYDDKNLKVYFEANDNKYIFFRKLPGICPEIYDGEEYPNTARTNCTYFQTYQFNKMDNKDYIETTYIDTLLKLYNKKIKVDYNKGIINIIDYDGSMEDNEIYKIAFGTSCFYVNEDSYILYEEPYIQKISNSYMIPLSVVKNYIKNVNVSWNGNTKTVAIINGNDEINFTVGSNYMVKNGESISINGITEILNSHVYIPARALGEALNFNVTWVENEKRVILTK